MLVFGLPTGHRIALALLGVGTVLVVALLWPMILLWTLAALGVLAAAVGLYFLFLCPPLYAYRGVCVEITLPEGVAPPDWLTAVMGQTYDPEKGEEVDAVIVTERRHRFTGCVQYRHPKTDEWMEGWELTEWAKKPL